MTISNSANGIDFTSLGLSPVALDFGFYELRWYSLAYLAGIFIGYWWVLRLLKEPGAPMARRHADDFVLWSALGVILGGRLGYVLFYNLDLYLTQGTTMFGVELPAPFGILNLRDGGMSFHGGAFGMLFAVWLYARKAKIQWLRMLDYVACAVPIGLFFGRLSNFVNSELWGAETDVSWAVRFPEMIGAARVLGPPRHPTQIYEALSEGLIIFIVLAILFYKTRARYWPGFLAGAFTLMYGIFRFLIEYVRLPDEHLTEFAQTSGMSMGQWLSLPMIIGGLAVMLTAKKRRERVEPIAGSDSVA